jgi:hypothetical protein
MPYLVPKGASFTVGRRTYGAGETLPADIPEATLLAHGFVAEKAAPVIAGTASAADTGKTAK